MNLAIIGPGALGCLLAAHFLESGERLQLVDHRPERAAALRRDGLVLHTLEGDRKILHLPIGLPGEINPADLVILAVKSYQTSAVAPALPRLLAPGGIALTLQNGLGNLEEMARVIGPERLLAGVIFAGATRLRDGEVIYAGLGATYLGAPHDSLVTPVEVAEVAALFHRAGLQCQARADIEVMLWEKLMVNVAINPLTGILRMPNGSLLHLPEAWRLAVAAAREAKEVALASGLKVTAEPEELVRRVCTATANNRSSMLQDVLAGRPTEIDALNAQVSQRAKSLGLTTPVNDFLTQAIRALHGPAAHPRS